MLFFSTHFGSLHALSIGFIALCILKYLCENIITNTNKPNVCVCKFAYGIRKINNYIRVCVFMDADAISNSKGLKISFAFQNTLCDCHLFKAR